MVQKLKTTQGIVSGPILEETLKKLEQLHGSFDYLKIKIASPERIRSWAERELPTGEIIGEVTRPETIHFRRHEPQPAGLFCERIFGPVKSWKCQCGKYMGATGENRICEECKVEITDTRVRRYRMGYIDLTYPVTHFWYLRGFPSYLTIILQLIDKDLKLTDLEDLVYFKEQKALAKYIFEQFSGLPESFEKKENPPTNQNQFKKLFSNSLESFKSSEKREGVELLKAALETINIKYEIDGLRSALMFGVPKKPRKKKLKTVENDESKKNSQQDFKTVENVTKKKSTVLMSKKRKKTQKKVQKQEFQQIKSKAKLKGILRKLRILESFFSTETHLSWMIFTILPVLPPNLRPLFELETGQMVASDLNEMYRLILVRNRRLLEIQSLFVPDLIISNGKKLLQECVDSLIDNARLAKQKQMTLNNKELKSLTENLEGKHGRFRHSLLGKRVDYSARSVIISGPHLQMDECGIPYRIALELFKPQLINEIISVVNSKLGILNVRLATILIQKKKNYVWIILKEFIKRYTILLNRAPTLHRFGIQGFQPILVLDLAIHLHPLVCTGFNADFDGDQMAIHLPLYETSQLEVRQMMLSSFHVLSPANGDVILKPTQDMVIGCYYLTFMSSKIKDAFQYLPSLHFWFSNEENALQAYSQKKITLHTPILVRYKISNISFEIHNQRIRFSKAIENYLFRDKDIFIQKIFRTNSTLEKFYLMTNMGILIAHQTPVSIIPSIASNLSNSTNLFKQFFLTDFFLETSPGRLIFNQTFRAVRQDFEKILDSSPNQSFQEDKKKGLNKENEK